MRVERAEARATFAIVRRRKKEGNEMSLLAV